MPGLQEPAAGRGGPFCAARIPQPGQRGPPAAGRGLCAVGPQSCPGDQGQVPIIKLKASAGLVWWRTHIHFFSLQVQQNRLPVSKCRNYAESSGERQSLLQGSVFQVKLLFGRSATPVCQCIFPVVPVHLPCCYKLW